MSSIHAILMSAPPAALITPAARSAFEGFSTDEQKQVVDKMLVLIGDLRNGTDEQRKALGVPWTDDQSQNETNVHLVLDQCYWQLSQFFRVHRNPVILMLKFSCRVTNIVF
jgi:hypothetical protein